MEALDKLIYNLLSSGQGVTLPWIGSLHVEQIKTSLNGTTLTPASRRVKFSNRESSSLRTLTTILTDDYGLTAEEAKECYKEWLTSARRGAGLHIEGVGDVVKSYFKPTEEFDSQALNPWRTPQLKLHRRTSPLPWIFVCCTLLGAAGAWAYLVYGDQLLAQQQARRTARAERKAAMELMAEQAPEIVQATPTEEEDATETDAMTQTTTAQEIEKEVATPAATPERTESAQRTSSAQGISERNTITAQQTSSAQTTQRPDEPKNITPAEREPATTSTTTSAPSNIAITPAEATMGKWFVVAGVYSTDANAERFIAADELGVGRVAYTKHPFTGGKILVAVGVYDTSEEAAARRRELLPRNSSIWTWHR